MTPRTGVAHVQVVSSRLIWKISPADPTIEVVRRSPVRSALVLRGQFGHHSLPCKFPALFCCLNNSTLRHDLGGRFEQIEALVKITATEWSEGTCGERLGAKKGEKDGSGDQHDGRDLRCKKCAGRDAAARAARRAVAGSSDAGRTSRVMSRLDSLDSLAFRLTRPLHSRSSTSI